jgi:hypothetical protein
MEKERGKPCKKTGRKNGQELIAYLPDSIKPVQALAFSSNLYGFFLS